MAASIEHVVRNFTLGILLAAVSASAQAEVWIETSRNDDYLAYADPSSVRRDGDLVKMWSMLDYKNPQDLSVDAAAFRVRLQARPRTGARRLVARRPRG